MPSVYSGFESHGNHGTGQSSQIPFSPSEHPSADVVGFLPRPGSVATGPAIFDTKCQNALAGADLATCSASTTASNSLKRDSLAGLGASYEPICDWLSWRHDYAQEAPGVALKSGRIMKINQDGVIEWESLVWGEVRCPSSERAVRVKCDGAHLWFSGNPGAFLATDNIKGVGVMEAFEASVDIIAKVFPEMRLSEVGSVFREDTVSEFGTRLKRIDLAGNCETDAYASLVAVLSSRRIDQRLPMAGKYGPTWGYETKRGQWAKAKLYDKSAESEGRRVVATGPTLARFEVQLGSEYLRQKGLSRLKVWGEDMGQIVYGRFLSQVLREQVGVEDWSEIPARLRHHAVMWRDGVPVRSYVSRSAYYKARAKLLGYGIDIGVPCNVLALTQKIRVVEVRMVDAMRRAG
jgi:Phage X family